MITITAAIITAITGTIIIIGFIPISLFSMKFITSFDFSSSSLSLWIASVSVKAEVMASVESMLLSSLGAVHLTAFGCSDVISKKSSPFSFAKSSAADPGTP